MLPFFLIIPSPLKGSGSINIVLFLIAKSSLVLFTCLYSCSDGSGSKIFDSGQVRSNFCCLSQVGSDQPSLVWVWIWKISSKNVKFLNFCPSSQKNVIWSGQKVPRSKQGRPLIYCRSKVCSGRVGSGPISILLQPQKVTPNPFKSTLYSSYLKGTYSILVGNYFHHIHCTFRATWAQR